MILIENARFLIRQFLHNLDEADWASRHVAEYGPDLPQPAKMIGFDRPVSSLSLALQQMGLVRQSPENTMREFDA